MNASRKRSVLILLLFAFGSFYIGAQSNKIDSLKSIWRDGSNHDTTRMRATLLVSQFYTDNQPDSSIYYADLLIEESQKKKYRGFNADALFSKGRSYLRKGQNESAFSTISKSLSLYEKLDNQSGIANCYNTMGGIFMMQKDSVKCDEYFLKALHIFEKLKDKKGIAMSYMNLSAGRTSERTADYIQKGYELFKELGDKKGAAMALYKLALLKLTLTKSKEIPIEFFECLKTFEEANNLIWSSYMHASISEMYLERKEYQKAYEFSLKGYNIANQHGLSKERMDNLRILVRAAASLNKYKEAYQFFTVYISERDSVNSADVNNSIAQQEMSNAFERQKALDKKEQEKQLAIAKEKESRQKLLSYGIAVVLLLVLIFSVIISGKLRLTHKQKKIIEEQNKNTEKQKEIIEAKQKEIIDSINYAKRLQEAILPTEEFVKTLLPDSFVFFKPKDIVAGDFYWMESVSSLHVGADLIFIAAADCTGHGVPGAIVSMVCHNALNRALLEYEITDPGKILNITRELIISTFEKSDADVKDGMDISLCCINNKTNELSWAGANNPLWIVKQQNREFLEFKPNKQPIGKVDEPKPFTTHKIDLNKGDTIYLFTDGFADQFGGPKGKKFKYKQLEELLVSMHDLPMSEQSNLLDIKFNQWKRELEQVDDVCVIGIKI